MVEACDIGETTIEVHRWGLGTYAPIQDTIVFPDSPGGTGSSTVTVTPTGEPAIERALSFSDDGFATYQELPDGGRNFDLDGYLTLDDKLHRLRLAFTTDASGTLQGEPIVTLSTYVGEDFRQWEYIPGLHAPPGVALDLTVDGAQVSGTLTGTVYPEASIQGSFEATVEPWRWPPEGSCEVFLAR